MNMDNDETFLMHKEWCPLFLTLPDTQAGALIKAICRYQLDDDPAIDDPTLSAVMAMITAQMDDDTRAQQ